MDDGTQNLSRMVHVTQHQSVTKTTPSRACSGVVHLARVGVRVIVFVVDVVCLMLVLSAHVVLLVVCIQFVARFL